MILTFDPLDAAVYRRWLRWMLALDPAPAATRYADALFRDHGPTIERVARELARALLPRIWTAPERELYRGLRLEHPDLHGRPLPPHPAYDTLPALSFSEELAVACCFCDPGPRGFPTLPITNTVTGKPGLPPHGYVATAVVHTDDVLFHWRYALTLPALFTNPGEDLSTLLEQREVTVRTRPERTQQLHALEHLGRGYLAAQYGGQ